MVIVVLIFSVLLGEWELPEHDNQKGGRCSGSGKSFRETGWNGVIPYWPLEWVGDRVGGTVPPFVEVDCSGCGVQFIGLGPL